jgi:hypothetical protein
MIRIGDAERERAVAVLRRHYAAGRLNADELDERLHAALAARFDRDLHGALRELPRRAGVLRIAALGLIVSVWIFMSMVLLFAAVAAAVFVHAASVPLALVVAWGVLTAVAYRLGRSVRRP